ncbi:lipoprotein signal peptidase [Romeria aff. gracilis LEGE 07310]|uniref:Lipoprotein signal peptidase n=1 Tax=Vasconcelosia minhoensis LEGE 07310 TaxID=915328 RepID=A0A8J7AFX6_9CYAN|nr:signal peptidase II [Romeria gracilis]MBE9078179.1 lipoprotein signal peptidase [Romeria aff. gracilis LEGE 07310]
MSLRNPLFWLVAVVGLGLDQLTKLLVVQNFELTSPPQSIPLIPGVLNFTYVTNTGAAWSLFSENGEWLRWLSLIVSLGLAFYGLLTRIPTRWEQVGYGLILSGAFGNGIDRLRSGEVVDFIQVFPITRFPVFNLADIWINIGIICLLLTLVLVPEDENGSKRRR